MTSLLDAVQDYCGSEYYLLLDSNQKEHAETLLSYWCTQIDEDLSPDTMGRALKDVAHLDVPVEIRRAFPDLLKEFFNFLSSTGKYPNTTEAVDILSQIEPEYVKNFRDDGSFRGETVRKTLPKVGRNDPCPCGSGKKYKKCCIGLFS